MYAQAKKIEGLMQSVIIADQFCQRAGISLVMADTLPHWFFIESGMRDKQLALRLAKIYDEAAALKEAYSDQLVAQVEERFPLLFEHVMNNQKPGSSFVMILGQQYHQSAPTLNLVKLMNGLKESYPSHFIWAHDPHRYQIIIDGLRAEQIEAAMELEKTNRYATNIQNRMAKGISTLAAMDQHECLLKRPERIGEQLADSVQAIDLRTVEVVNESK